MTTKNIVTDYGAVADGAWALEAFTISMSTPTHLHAPTGTDPWIAGSGALVGKSISVGTAGGSSAESQGGTALRTTIAGWVSATEIILADAAVSVLPNPNVTDQRYLVAWGTDNNTAFTNFRNDFAGQTGVVLTIPSGVYLILAGNFGGIWQGIKELTVNMTGAAITGGTWQIGSGGQSVGSTFSRTNAASAGDTSITLSTPAEHTRFTVGTYVLMTGINIQYGGYPSNHQRYEWKYITAIDTGTGEITFSEPLLNSYLTTWPVYNTGSDNFDGGPAQLYNAHASESFDHTLVVNGGRFVHHAQWAVFGLSITLNDCVMEGIYGPYGTTSKNWTMNNCTGLTCFMELDKYNWDVTLNGCTWGGIAIQSSTSARTFTLDDTTITFSIVGTPYNTIIRNGSSIGTLVPGSQYGWGNDITADASIISNFGAVGTHESGNLINGGANGNTGINNDFTMSGGIITVPNTWYAGGYLEQWAVTGHNIFWLDGGVGQIGRFTITDLTQDASNLYIHTDWSGGFPSRSYLNGKLWLRCAPVRSCTFTNVTGCEDVVSLSLVEANKPLYSRSKRNYDGSVAVASYFQMWGRIDRVKFTPTRLYSGSFGGAVTSQCQFTNSVVKESDFTDYTSFNPIFDVHHSTATLSSREWIRGVGWTGTQAGDTLVDPPFDIWACGNTRMLLVDITSDAANRPTFTIEIDTDPGIVNVIPSSSSVVFSDRVLDLGITILNTEANALFLCSAEPSDYATALSLQLATKTGTIFNSPTAATLGRKVVSNAITDGSNTANGTVTYWAVVDTVNSRLLAHGPVVQSHAILNGQKFTVPAFSLEIDRG